MISAVNVGFDKDLVHLPSFWKILSFSLFDFCQHQVLKPQEVLKSVTSLRCLLRSLFGRHLPGTSPN